MAASDGSEPKNLKINGYDALYTARETGNHLPYSTNKFLFTFGSDTLGEKEFIRIVESLESLDDLR